MVFGIHFRYPFPWFSRLGGSGLLTTSRLNDFELIELSDGGGWRGPCMAGGKAAAEARAVTAGAVRCSALLGLIVVCGGRRL